MAWALRDQTVLVAIVFAVERSFAVAKHALVPNSCFKRTTKMNTTLYKNTKNRKNKKDFTFNPIHISHRQLLFYDTNVDLRWHE